MKYALLVLVFLFSSSAAHGQAGQATEIKSGPTNPATCNPARGWLFWNNVNFQMNDCTSTNTWAVVAGGSGSGAGTFNISTACNGAANCLQWVDDDSTDNCGSATTTFMAAYNAYAGPGRPQLFIWGSGAGKAYKLASCTLAMSISTGAVMHIYATIDCAQTAVSCIQVGPSGQVAEQAKENYAIDGNGTLVGGANLTTAGIYVEPGVLQFDISHLQFGKGNTGLAADGFGATNATLGNCTNYSIYVDSPVATGYITNIFDFVASSSTTVGGCGLANPAGSVGGSNTIFYNNNVVATSGAIGASQCGSIGILDGGTLGASIENNIYGIGMPFRIQGIGHRLLANQIDAAGCTAKSVSAAIHIGANGSSTAVSNITIDSNIAQIITAHTQYLVAQAGDSSAGITGMSIIGNQNNNAPITFPAAITPTGLNCTPLGAACYIAGNIGFNNVQPGLSGTMGTGWATPTKVTVVFSPAVQSANLGSTSMGTAPSGIGARFLWCTVVETVKDLTSSTLPSCVVSYADQISGVTATQTVTTTNTTNAVGAAQSGFVAFNVAAGTTINISTTGYASNVAGTMKYQLQAFLAEY